MSTKLEILKLLSAREGKYISGQALAEELGISRNSIWKAVNALEKQGYRIDAEARRGYRLVSQTDIISKDYLKETLGSDYGLHILEKVTSTNDYAKTLDDLSTPQIVIANEETRAFSKSGKHFYAPPGKGLYMTIAFRPDFALDAYNIRTALTAVVICRALEESCGVRPRIKWVNDVYLNRRKLCCTLTEIEANFETGRIDRMYVGIGINCFPARFPEEIAGSVNFIESPAKEFSRSELAANIVRSFFEMLACADPKNYLKDYKTRSFMMGSRILIYNPEVAKECGRTGQRVCDPIRARAIDIDDNGGLIVEFLEGRKAHQMKTLMAGRIKIEKE